MQDSHPNQDQNLYKRTLKIRAGNRQYSTQVTVTTEGAFSVAFDDCSIVDWFLRKPNVVVTLCVLGLNTGVRVHRITKVHGDAGEHHYCYQIYGRTLSTK